MKLLLNVNLYLKVFPFHMLPAWVKHQIVDINIQGYFLRPKILLYAQHFQWAQNSIFPNGKKTYFSRFIAKFLKFLVISHSLCYIWNVNNLIYKLPILFATVKFKLGYFSQFIHKCKIGIFECWSVLFVYFLYFLRFYFQVVPNSQRDFVIFKCCSSRTYQFFPIHDKVGKLGFLKTSLDCTSKFFPIH